MNIGELILYKNNQLIAFNKPSGLAVQPDATGDKALVDLGEIYCKSTLHLIHRLDRPASGVILFAKSKNALVTLNSQFQSRAIGKTYLAVVKDAPPETEGTLIHFLKKEGSKYRTKVYKEEVPGSKRAEMRYKVVGQSDRYHLLEIELVTGRHHQIRAQLSAIGCPIRGDEKYGFRRANRDRSIQLHAWKLSFHHPVTNEKVVVEATPPADKIWEAFDFLKA